MPTQHTYKKLGHTIAFFVVTLLFLASAYKTYAALSCSVTTAGACSDIVVLRMSGSSNAHAELSNQANVAYDDNVVCCSGVSGLGNSCSGTYGVIAGLSAVTNAHVERNDQGNYGQQACISAPGSVTVGYRANNCNTYDTAIASISDITNAQIGDPTAYNAKICASASAGSLTADIVDSGGTTVASPSVSLTSTPVGFGCQTSTGTLGTASQKIRVTNATGSGAWTLSIAGSATTALWTGASSFDFNDTTSAGCADGADADSFAGRMSHNASGATITPEVGCTTTGLSLAGGSAYAEGTNDSISLVGASAGADTGCYWDITDIALAQTIPAEQNVSSYSMSYVITVVAN